MRKLLLVVCMAAVMIASGECGLLKNIFQHKTTTEEPATTTAAPPLFINNNVQRVDANCMVNFECKKKLKGAAAPKPCVKYCVKTIECGDEKIKGDSSQCVELNEALVQQDHDDGLRDGTISTMRVAMIDFPCQPGYLPDSRGRCREVW